MIEPWKFEPDRLEWRDEETGFPCLIVRGPMGALCGYVGVSPGHPQHGMDYDAVDVEVHGGLTYSEKCEGSICHVPAPGESDDVWWLGFDCAHPGDHMPKLEGCDLLWNPHASYKDISFVRKEVTKLAKQLHQSKTQELAQ